MKYLMFIQTIEGTLVQEHVLKKIYFINKVDMIDVELDSETKVDAILASLPNSFNQLVMNYNMNKMNVTLFELLEMLEEIEDLIKKEV